MDIQLTLDHFFTTIASGVLPVLNLICLLLSTSHLPLSTTSHLYFIYSFISSHIHLYKRKIQRTYHVWTFCWIILPYLLFSDISFTFIPPRHYSYCLLSSLPRSSLLLQFIAQILLSLWSLPYYLPCLSKINYFPYWHCNLVTVCSSHHYIRISIFSHFII